MAKFSRRIHSMNKIKSDVQIKDWGVIMINLVQIDI